MKHLDFIRSLPCCICRDNTSTECAHIRFSDARAAKPVTGMGTKSGDEWVLPLCGKHHREQHTFGERKWWSGMGKDPIFLAMALHRVSGDQEAAEMIINAQ